MRTPSVGLNIIIQTREVATGVATIGRRNAVRAQRAPRKSRLRTRAITIPTAIDPATESAVNAIVRPKASQKRPLASTAP